MMSFARTWAVAALTAAGMTGSTPVFAAAPSSAEQSAEAAVEALLAVDRAHAARARRTGRAGLLEMFDDDVIMPSPAGVIVMGKPAVAALLGPGTSGGLSWAPVRGGISADGRQGFTLGYMDETRPDGATRALKYISYWRRGDGGWRVVAFKRTDHPTGARSGAMPPSLPQGGRIRTGGMAAEQRALIAREQAFSDAAGRMGLGRAFAAFGREDAVNMGRTAAFTVGAAAIGRDLDAGRAPDLAWSAEGAMVAESGDLGLTWGHIRLSGASGGERKVPYFTVWRRTGEGEWRYIAE
jgi:ketosteroid isomerase-like protein